MTWLRIDTDAARSGVAGDLARDLGIKPMLALGHYVAAILGFGEHQPDGVVASVDDHTLENWAFWKGKEGRFAAAFRARCTSDGSGKDPVGVVRGWWRQDALLRKQAKDASRPPSHLRHSPDIPAGESGAILGGDGVRSTEDVDEKIPSSTPHPGRLMAKLVGHPARYAVVEFLEAVPETQSLAAWSLCLNGCLEGMGMQQSRRATVDELAAACNDYRGASPEKWGVTHFRSFVDRIVAKRFRSKAADIRLPKASVTDRAVAAAKAFAEGGE